MDPSRLSRTVFYPSLQNTIAAEWAREVRERVRMRVFGKANIQAVYYLLPLFTVIVMMVLHRFSCTLPRGPRNSILGTPLHPDHSVRARSGFIFNRKPRNAVEPVVAPRGSLRVMLFSFILPTVGLPSTKSHHFTYFRQVTGTDLSKFLEYTRRKKSICWTTLMES